MTNMTAGKRLQYQNHLSDVETEVTTWSLVDPERVTIQFEIDIDGTTSNEMKRLKKEFSICMTVFEPWWETIGILALWKIIEQGIIYFGYRKIHLGCHI
jgi:hypothetical protein